MITKEFLIDVLQKKIIADSALQSTIDRIKQRCENIVLKKYSDEVISCDGLDFQLVGANSYFHNYDKYFSIAEIDLRLGFFCISKLDKSKREKLEEAKETYIRKKYMPCSNHKKPLWFEKYYDIRVDEVFSGNINLSFF